MCASVRAKNADRLSRRGRPSSSLGQTGKVTAYRTLFGSIPPTRIGVGIQMLDFRPYRTGGPHAR